MKKWLASCFFITVLLSSPAHGGADPRTEGLVDTIIRQERLEHELAQLPETLSILTSTNFFAADSPQEKKRKRDMLISAFDPAAALRQVKEYFLAQGDTGTFEQVAAWIDSPIGKKISAVEAESETFESQANELLFFSRLDSAPPSAARVDKIRAIVAASGELDMFLRLLDGLARNVPGKEMTGEEPAKVRERIERSGPVLTGELRQEAFLDALYTYRSVSDEELDDYVRFLRSDACQRFFRLAIEATGRAFDSFLERYMKALTGDGRGLQKGVVNSH